MKIKTIVSYVVSFLASVIGVGLNFYLARVFEAQVFGRIQYLIALATTFSQFLIFGINSFLVREATNKKHGGELFNKCFSLYLLIFLFFVPILYFASINHIAYTTGNTVLTILIVIMAILMGANSLIASFYQGNGKYHVAVIFENLLPKLLLLIVCLIFIGIGQKVFLSENYVLFYIIAYLAIAIPFILILFKRINLKFEKNDLKSIFFFFGVTVTYSLGNNLTKVLQGGLFLNDVALAIISLSLSFVSLIRVITGVLDGIVKPIFAKKMRENDIDGLFETYSFNTRINMYVSVPIYLFFILNPTRFLVVFGESYLAYPLILVIISIANAVSDLTGPNGTMLAMTGKEKWELVNGFVYFGVYIVSIFVFSFNKVYGLSLSLLVAQLVVNIIKYIEVWVIFKRTPLDIKTIITMFIILAVNFAVILPTRFINVHIVLWFVIGITIGLGLVALNLFVFSFYRKHDFKKMINLKL